MVRTLEFRNNGIIDSLTGAMAPALFYENLHREISAADRDRRTLSIISIVVVRRKLGEGEELDAPLSERIIKITSLIDHGMRADEYFSRISEDGFWVLIRGTKENALMAIKRAELDPDIRIEVVEREEGESFRSWVSRVDRVHFA